MAQGWTWHLLGDTVGPYSAGIEAQGIYSNAVKVMAQAGVDITEQFSKLADTLADVDFDVVITVCGQTDENWPACLGKSRVVRAGSDDPPQLANTAATEESALRHYRRVRDEIRTFVESELPK